MACELRVVTLRALAARLEANARQRVWQEYVANTGWNLVKAVASALGGSYDVPSFTELTSERPRDERTGAEIVADVLETLESRVMGNGNGSV